MGLAAGNEPNFQHSRLARNTTHIIIIIIQYTCISKMIIQNIVFLDWYAAL
jgi:hypothetical protein